MRRILWCPIFLAFCAAPAPAGVVGSKHDLSVSGSGQVKAFGEDEICIFCHAPHNAAPATPLWNRQLTTLVYTPYSSSSLEALTGQPTNASKLCLSCHDGTIALGAVLNRVAPIPMSGPLPSEANLATDLSDDHPVSFAYDSGLTVEDPELRDPATLTGVVQLDADGQMQCTSCHDAHDDSFGMFLLMDGEVSSLCVACHAKNGWPGSSHDTSSAGWSGAGVDPWPVTPWTTVAANGCSSCHFAHSAGSPERLLRFGVEEENCLVCHDGNVSRVDVASELRKPHTHPVDSFLGVHDPVEDFFTMPRHVECEDCHDPHAVTATTASPPDVSGALEDVAGVSIGGVRVDRAASQYEVCLRCHGDNANQPSPAIQRQVFQSNLRLKIDPANPSFHPVVSPGQNPMVPSLIPPWTEASVIYCTDCHANDTGPGAGGTGPAGPHGSTWPFLLEREYRTGDNTPESLRAYALCYKCHSQSSILADQSFKKHKLHVQKENSPCSACHDPHGISATQGSAVNHTHLINFDTTIVAPDPSSGLLQFEDLGNRSGRCFLRCHGENHGPKSY